MAQHGGAAISEVSPGVDMEAVVTGTEASDGAGHMNIETVHLGEHNPPLDGVSLHYSHSRLGLKKSSFKLITSFIQCLTDHTSYLV